MSTLSTAVAVADKAARLYHEGRAVPLGPSYQFWVEGDSDSYLVTIGEQRTLHTCSCPAHGVCSHIAAAMLAHGQRDEARP